MSLCALAFASCQKAEIEDINASEGKYTYTLVGTASPEVKASVGDKVDNKWPMLWEAGDKIGVYSADGATLIGVAEIAAADAGKNMATFTLTTDQELTNGQALSIKYPYVEGATATVPTKQSLAAANSSAGVGANAVATATTTFAGEDTAFELSYSNAYLRFVLNTEEYKDYTLNGVTLWADGTELSGAAEDYAKVTLAQPAVLGTGNNVVWMTANPMDLTGKTVWAIVHMTKGIETVTLPVELRGAANLPANAVTSVQLPKLAKALAPAWYEPVETRYIAAYGDGWSYGPENTILFTENGQEKTIDVKARGNFMKVKQPAKVKVNNVHGDSGMISNALFINDVDGNTSDAFDLSATYTFKAKMNVVSSYGYFSNLLVQDNSGKTIWGLNLWLVEETMQTAAYNDGTVVDRNIGACGVTSKRKNYRCQGAYFQWGRPFGFPWSTNNKGTSYATTDNTNDLQKSAENPFVLYGYDNGGNGDGYPWDWLWGDGSNKNRTGDLDDLWGNPQSDKTDMTTVGHKSIYDPCPKGYKVVIPSIINEVSSNVSGELDENNKYISSGEAVVYTDNTNSHYVVYKGISWGFHGFYAPALGAKKIGDAKTGALAYWSNANYQANAHQWYFRINGNKLEKGVDRTRAAAMPIRCMVDTENR